MYYGFFTNEVTSSHYVSTKPNEYLERIHYLRKEE